VDIRKKKQKNVEPGSPNSDIEGDAWIFTFITRGTYLIVAYEIGKRTKKTFEKLFEKVFDRVQLPFPDMKIEIFSDGHEDYTNTQEDNLQYSRDTQRKSQGTSNKGRNEGNSGHNFLSHGTDIGSSCIPYKNSIFLPESKFCVSFKERVFPLRT
jgi:IS1 family transposase